jgi:predicted transcriptional regulator
VQNVVVYGSIYVGYWPCTERSPRMLADVKIDGEKVRAARERAFLSKRELAERADLDRSTIGRIEDGVTEVYPRTIRKIAEALSVDPATLVPKE